MTAFNEVRFRVRVGHDQKFIDAHKNISWPGLRHAYMIKTSEGARPVQPILRHRAVQFSRQIRCHF